MPNGDMGQRLISLGAHFNLCYATNTCKHTHTTQNLKVLNYYYVVEQAGTAEKATTNPKKHTCTRANTQSWRFPMEEGPVQQHTMLYV